MGRNIERLLSTRSPGIAGFHVATGSFTAVRNHHRDYWTGTVYTTNRRVWEFDDNFKDYLRRIRCMAVDMETATLFSVGFANQIPVGALLLVSDQPMISTGVKTEESDKNHTGFRRRTCVDRSGGSKINHR